jgi:hypothetical protein
VFEALKRGRTQSETRMGEPSPLKAWPDVPTRVLLCRNDRLFPARFLRRVARERLAITPNEIDSGHTPALSRPKGAGRLPRGVRGRAGHGERVAPLPSGVDDDTGVSRGKVGSYTAPSAPRVSAVQSVAEAKGTL